MLPVALQKTFTHLQIRRSLEITQRYFFFLVVWKEICVFKNEFSPSHASIWTNKEIHVHNEMVRKLSPSLVTLWQSLRSMELIHRNLIQYFVFRFSMKDKLFELHDMSNTILFPKIFFTNDKRSMERCRLRVFVTCVDEYPSAHTCYMIPMSNTLSSTCIRSSVTVTRSV